MNSLIAKLRGGDRRSIGRANEVVAEVIKSPDQIKELFEGLFDNDPVVRARTADALEKIAAKKPEWLRPYRARLLNDVAPIEQNEVRWHVAQILGRVPLMPKQTKFAVTLLKNYLTHSNSEIVKVSALQSLANLSADDATLRRQILKLLGTTMKSGSPALRAREKHILRRLERRSNRGK